MHLPKLSFLSLYPVSLTFNNDVDNNDDSVKAEANILCSPFKPEKQFWGKIWWNCFFGYLKHADDFEVSWDVFPIEQKARLLNKS